MEFKKPQPLKRRSDGDEYNSPLNRKKSRSLLSTTIATPQKTESDPFDDNFSQFFRSQFIKQIPELDVSFARTPKVNEHPPKTEYNFTQLDGLSQFFYDTELDTSIPAGQQSIGTNAETVNRDDDKPTEQNVENVDCPTEFGYDQNDNKTSSDVDDDENFDHGGAMQCSQLFLEKLTELQVNISSIVNETINANRFHMDDFLDPANDQYEVFTSTVTESQYMHRKRPNEPAANALATVTPKNEHKTVSTLSNVQTNLSTELMEDQLLAEMVFATQALANNTEMLEDQLLAQYDEHNETEQLNDCIDPDSSALAHLLADYDDDEKENAEIVTKNGQQNQRTPANVNRAAVQVIQRYGSAQHTPVTASKFYSMGPYFGLPTQVKKLIKTFKNIDDLYGKIRRRIQLSYSVF